MTFKALSTKLCPLTLLIFSASSGLAIPFLPGNIAVSQTDPVGSPEFVLEYDRSGFHRQTIGLPQVPGHVLSDFARDMVFDRFGRLHVYNGTLNAVISTLQSNGVSWVNTSIPTLQGGPTVWGGKLDMYWDYLFMTDAPAGSTNTFGVVRYNTITGATTRFANAFINDQPIDVTIGNDGLLYTLVGSGAPGGDTIDIYDPVSLSLLRSINLTQTFRNGNRTIAVGSQGEIYIVNDQNQGQIHKLSPTGFLIETLTLNIDAAVWDLDINRQGELLIGSTERTVAIVNSDFKVEGPFPILELGRSELFAAWVSTPVPEPSTVVIMTIGALLAMRRRKS